MTKRRIEISDDLLERARVVLGTSSDSETVNEALRRILARPRPGLIDGPPVDHERDGFLDGFGER